jgi:hypothetical protein
MSEPPHRPVKMAPGKPFFSRTFWNIFVTAIVTRGVVGAPFLYQNFHFDKKNEYNGALPLTRKR